VSKIDGRVIGQKIPGTMTQKLSQMYHAYIEEYVDENK